MACALLRARMHRMCGIEHCDLALLVGNHVHVHDGILAARIRDGERFARIN